MFDRIQAICQESSDLLALLIGNDVATELAINWVIAALDDLEASENPTDEQVEEIFVALANLQQKLMACLPQIPQRHYPLLENLTDRIDIFLFHHRL